MDVRLLCVGVGVDEGVLSIPVMDGGRPDIDLEEPRAGGGAGTEVGDVRPAFRRLAGRRDGGGGGARVLFERDTPPPPMSKLRILEESSSGFGDKRPESLRVSFDSETN